MERISLKDYIIKEVRKNNSKFLFNIFLILDEIAEEKNIISFKYEKPYLWVRVSIKDYYRIELKEVN